MRLFNESRGVLLAENLTVADTFWKRLRGLLGTSAWPEGNALLIRPCNSVHMFGMKYCLDVLFVDRQNLVMDTAESLAPGKIKICRRARYAVELPAGTLRRTGTSNGDRLQLI